MVLHADAGHSQTDQVSRLRTLKLEIQTHPGAAPPKEQIQTPGPGGSVLILHPGGFPPPPLSEGICRRVFGDGGSGPNLPYAQNLPGMPSTFCKEGGLGLWSSLHPLVGAPPGTTHSAISLESRYFRCNKLLVWLLIGPPFGKGTQFNRLNQLNSYWECCSDLSVIVFETSLGQKDVGVFLSLFTLPGTVPDTPFPLCGLGNTPWRTENVLDQGHCARSTRSPSLPQTDGVTEDGDLVSHPTCQGASDARGPEPRQVSPPPMGVCCLHARSELGVLGACSASVPRSPHLWRGTMLSGTSLPFVS